MALCNICGKRESEYFDGIHHKCMSCAKKDHEKLIAHKQSKINNCLQLVRVSNRKTNEIRSSNGESPTHRAKKEEICNALEADGHSYICEPIFKTGGRADILVLDLFKIIEIAVSESDASLKAKEEYYPQGLTIEVIRCQKIK